MEQEFYVSSLFRIIYWLNMLFAIYIMVKVVLNNRNPLKTLAWMLVLLFVPFLGLVLYFFFGSDTRRRRYISRRSMSQIQQRVYRAYSGGETIPVPACCSKIVSYFKNVADARLMTASGVRIITDGTCFLEALMSEIRSAKEHIHLMFYIFEDDATGRLVRDALMARAREGVEVRLIYDSVGCWSVPSAFYDEIRCAGGYVAPFLKVRFPLFTNKVNYRNHRKVVVVDGKTAFVGGFNIADRYINGGKYGCWRDTMLQVTGDAVHGLQATFLIDWYFADHSLVSGSRYFPANDSVGDIPVQVVTSNPVGHWRTVMNGLIMSLAAAHRYIYLQTPYLMPGEPVIMALQNAALAGADVRLMLPLRSDSRLTDYASYSYLGDLMQAGVKVYLYEKGFLHSKIFVADDILSSVGSVNIDFRSFEYNFEIAAYMYDAAVAVRLKSLFVEDIKASRLLTLKDFRERSLRQRCLESAARLFSPIL